MREPDLKREGEYELHYRIIKRLGGPSGMGQVYLAYDEHLEKKVAIKYPSKETDTRRFLIGGKAAARLEHPNIIKILYLSTNPLFMVMDYLEGGDLRSRLDKGILTLVEKYALVEKVLRGLGCAHRNEVVHRDLKPENIMFKADNEPVVVDFDLSKFHASTVNAGTIFGISMGTPPYMSPEQVLGKIDQIGPATDIYALGIIIFELFLGSRFWPIDGDTLAEMMHNHVVKKPKSFYQEALRKGLPKFIDEPTVKRIDQIINRCLQKEIAERYKSTEEMLAEWKMLAVSMSSSAKFDFSQQTLLCPNCRVKVNVTSRFCHNCGIILQTAKKMPFSNDKTPTVPENKPQRMSIQCHFCQKEVDGSLKYCSNCGAVLGVESKQKQPAEKKRADANSKKEQPDFKKKCVSCGAQLKPGEKYCLNCGKPVN